MKIYIDFDGVILDTEQLLIMLSRIVILKKKNISELVIGMNY